MWHVYPKCPGLTSFRNWYIASSSRINFSARKANLPAFSTIYSVIFYMKENPVKNYLPFLGKNFIEAIAQKSVGLNGFQLNGMAEAIASIYSLAGCYKLGLLCRAFM